MAARRWRGIVPGAGELRLQEELSYLFTLEDVTLGATRPDVIKRAVEPRFLAAGWAKDVHLPHSNLTISYLREDVGICFQLGNVSRTYADLLKLQTMQTLNRIKLGVEIVPMLEAARRMGSNHAQYERLDRELDLFQMTVTGPMLVLGLAN